MIPSTTQTSSTHRMAAMSNFRSLRTLAGRLLAIVTLLLSLSLALAGRGEAASTAHPYSNPVWWPLSASGTKMGCYHGNGPDCLNPLRHKVYAMEITAPDNSAIPVYAMGAGVAHVVTGNWTCGQSSGRGNWLYVDHADGTTSEYGHLGTIFVKSGQLVTPRTELGTVGRSGLQPACDDPALDSVRVLWLAIRHNGTYFHFTTSYACRQGQQMLWPTTMSTYPTNDWNKVPAHTPLPSSARTCMPTTAATPAKPLVTSLVNNGADALRVAWTAARPADHVTVIKVQLQQSPTGTTGWVDYANRRLTSGYTATTFRGLPTGPYFRARVWMANSVGWSAPSYWASPIRT
jgi:peptidase M23-like protein